MIEQEHSIARRTAYATAAQIVSILAGFASAIITARLLGASGRGVLSLVGLVGVVVVGGASFGIGPALSYLMGKHRYRMPTLTLTAVVFAVLFGAPAAIIVVLLEEPLLAGVLRGLQPIDLYLTAAGLPSGYATLFLGQVLVGAGRIRLFSILSALSALLYPVAVAVVVVIFGPDVHMVIAALLIVSWLVAILSFAGAGAGRGARLSDLRLVAREALPFGIKVWFGQALYLFYLRADSFFINYFSGVAAVGIYSIAVTLAEKIWLLAGAAVQSIFRDITRRALEDSTALTMRAARLTFLFAFASAILLAAVSPLIPVIFGEEFRASIILLLALLPGIVMISVGNVYNSFFTGQLGRPGTCSAVAGAMMVVSVVLYLTLIPPLGALGAAIGSSISYSVSLLSWLVLFPRATGARVRHMVVPTRADLSAARDAFSAEWARFRSSRLSRT